MPPMISPEEAARRCLIAATEQLLDGHLLSLEQCLRYVLSGDRGAWLRIYMQEAQMQEDEARHIIQEIYQQHKVA